MVHAGGVHQDQDAIALIPAYKAMTRHQGFVVQVLEQSGEYTVTQPIDGADALPSLMDLFPFPLECPFPALALVPDPYLCPSWLSHPLVIDIMLALIVQFHCKPPTLPRSHAFRGRK